MRISIYHNLKTDRSYSASTGLTRPEFDELAEDFCALYQVKTHLFPENFGNEPAFPDGKELLFMLLFYKKVYPTFAVLALSFGVSITTAHQYIQVAKALLRATLGNRNVLPKRFFTDEAEFQEFFKEVDEVFIDATERSIQRPANQDVQRASYSVKKKQCAFKNTFISARNTYIHFLGETVMAGKIVDFALLKKDLPAAVAALAKRPIWVDLGYLGIEKWWPNQFVLIPYKKPRKSKENPAPVFTRFQKAYNQFIGSNRVLVEHAIAGLKRYAIVANKFRNKRVEFADEMIELAAGLWNFKVLKRQFDLKT